MIDVVTFRILVRPQAVEDVDPAYAAAKRMGLDIVGDEKKRQQSGVDKGVVIACGPVAFKAYDVDNPLSPGDTIVYARNAGKEVTDPETDEKLLVINDEDVVAILRGAN